MANRIIVKKEGKLVSEVPLAPPMTIGRHPKSDLQLEDGMMSREHAKLSSEDGKLFVTDTSANGVRLGGQRIPKGVPHPVKNGDVIEVPGFELLVQLDARALSDTQAVESDAGTMTRPPAGLSLKRLLEKGIPVWSNEQDVELRVAEIIQETEDVKTFRLVGKDPLLFNYRPGQYLTVKVEVDGKQKNRCYTISSSPSRPHALEITVKRARAPQAGIPDGIVSNYLHDHIKLDDILRVHGPDGDFSCFNYPSEEYPSEKILCIAGGSGITPIMSMCRWIVDTRADVDVVVMLSFRSPSDIIFRRELEFMSTRHDDLKVLFTVTGRNPLEPWTGIAGRLCPQIFQLSVPDLKERHVYLCGPNPFMDTVKECLKELAFPTENLHTESFGKARVAPGEKPRREVVAAPAPPSAPAPGKPTPSKPAAPAKKLFKVTFKQSGIVAESDGEGGLLELAEANGVNIPAGCRMGSCLVCKVKCEHGEVRMEDNKLTPALKGQGFRVMCVGHAASDVVLDA
jgi:ferredoxin-NADP reductase/ferredoxin